jgi:hypothetical protein
MNGATERISMVRPLMRMMEVMSVLYGTRSAICRRRGSAPAVKFELEGRLRRRREDGETNEG